MECPLRNLVFAGARATGGRPYGVDKVRSRNVRTNPVGGGAHDAPQVSLQRSHKQKAPPVKGAARERLRDCLGFAEQKRKIVPVRYNPFAARSAAPPLTQGRLRSAPPIAKWDTEQRGAYGMPPTKLVFCQYAGRPVVARKAPLCKGSWRVSA